MKTLITLQKWAKNLALFSEGRFLSKIMIFIGVVGTPGFSGKIGTFWPPVSPPPKYIGAINCVPEDTRGDHFCPFSRILSIFIKFDIFRKLEKTRIFFECLFWRRWELIIFIKFCPILADGKFPVRSFFRGPENPDFCPRGGSGENRNFPFLAKMSILGKVTFSKLNFHKKTGENSDPPGGTNFSDFRIFWQKMCFL